MNLVMYTDGACLVHSSNTGSYSFHITDAAGNVFEGGASVSDTTCNRMELSAVIEGLNYLNTLSGIDTVYVFSDSLYVVNGINKWVKRWQKKNFKGIKNPDLWENIPNLLKSIKFKLVIDHIPGHSGITGNERCDFICNKLIETGKFDFKQDTLGVV